MRLKVNSNRNFQKKRRNKRLQKSLLKNLRTIKVMRMAFSNLLKIKRFQQLTSMMRLTQEIHSLNRTLSNNHLALSSICLMPWITTILSTSQCQSVICKLKSQKQSTVEMKMRLLIKNRQNSLMVASSKLSMKKRNHLNIIRWNCLKKEKKKVRMFNLSIHNMQRNPQLNKKRFKNINSLMKMINRQVQKNNRIRINQRRKKRKSLQMVKSQRSKSHHRLLTNKFPLQKNLLNQNNQKRRFTLMNLKFNKTMINLKMIMKLKLFHKQKDHRNKIKSKFKELLITPLKQKADHKMSLYKVLKSRNHFKNQIYLYLKSSCRENLLKEQPQQKNQAKIAINRHHNKRKKRVFLKLNNLSSKKLFHLSIHQIILLRKTQKISMNIQTDLL